MDENRHLFEEEDDQEGEFSSESSNYRYKFNRGGHPGTHHDHNNMPQIATSQASNLELESNI